MEQFPSLVNHITTTTGIANGSHLLVRCVKLRLALRKKLNVFSFSVHKEMTPGNTILRNEHIRKII